MGTAVIPSLPQPSCREISSTSQLVIEPTVEMPTFLPLRSSADLTSPSLRATSAKISGGPAMAAMPLTGEPLTMKARPGPEPKPTSMLSAAIACCTLASPPKLATCRSRPLRLKMPVWLPTSTGTKENAVRPALPTRNTSAWAESGKPNASATSPAKPSNRPRAARPALARPIMWPFLPLSRILCVTRTSYSSLPRRRCDRLFAAFRRAAPRLRRRRA